MALRSVALGVAVAGAFCLADAGLRAGQRAGPQTPIFSAGVDLVKVDVSVLDKQNQPVRGLTAKDFTLLEDGKPQQIQAFASVDLPSPDLKAATWTRDIAPDVRTNTDADDLRLVVLVIDDAMLPQDPTIVANTKKIARSVVERIGTEDLAAVVFTHDAKHGQEFTHDRARLLAAVETATSGGYSSGGGALSSVGAIEGLGQVLGTVADRRKTVIWIGIGVPATPWELSNAIGWEKEIYLRWVAAMDAVRRANVNVFTIDPGGLDGPNSAASSRVPTPTSNPNSRATVSMPGSDSTVAVRQRYQRYLQGLADNTGGRAFVNANEFDKSVAQIMRETGSFYLLGYTSTNAATGGRFRKIQVKVGRSGVSIRARSGYYSAGPESTQVSAAPLALPVIAALSGLLPRRDVPIRVTAATLAGPDDGTGVIVIAATVSPRVAPAAGGIDVLFEAFGVDGKLAASEHARASAAPRSGAGQFETTARLDLPVGQYQLRTAAGGEAFGGMGSVYVDVDVTDPRRTPLSWSGAVLGHTGDRRSALGPIVPLAPLSARTFTAADDVSAFARLYQGGATPIADATVRTRILDESGTARLDISEALVAARFGTNRAADVLRVLPISGLSAGQYLLSLEATAGKATARRDVRFEVR